MFYYTAIWRAFASLLSLWTLSIPVCVWAGPPPSPSCAPELLQGWTEASPENDKRNNFKKQKQQTWGCHTFFSIELNIFTFSSLLVGMARWRRLRTSWTFLPFIFVSTRSARSRSQAWQTQDHDSEPQHANYKYSGFDVSVKSAVPHLIFNLHDSLLGQSAGLNHGDCLGREICKDFLTAKQHKSVRPRGQDEPSTLRELKNCSFKVEAGCEL